MKLPETVRIAFLPIFTADERATTILLARLLILFSFAFVWFILTVVVVLIAWAV